MKFETLSNVELTPAQIKFLEQSFLELSIDEFCVDTWRVELAGQAASTRRFFRVSNNDKSYILVEWDSKDEDWPRFLNVEKFVSQTGNNILPKIFAHDELHGLILEEDLGAQTLKTFCNDNANNIAVIEEMYYRVIDELHKWHCIKIDDCESITSRVMDVETFLWESDYFARHCVTEFFGKENLLTVEWENERKLLAQHAASLPRVNMHRDFQSENILIHDDRVRFVDFQGSRLGPAFYDVASLLYDPYITQLNNDVIENLLNYYLSTEKKNATTQLSKGNFYICAAQRLMQALGAYCNLTIHKNKPHYKQYIPIALKRLSYIFDKHLTCNTRLPNFTYMCAVIKKLCE